MFKLTILILLSSVHVAYAALPSPPNGIRVYNTGAAHDFELQDIDGNTIKLSQQKGRWVFLHFWASWCGPCREEMPTINHLAQRYSDSDFKIIMVNTAEDEDTIFSFTSEISMDLPAYMDRDGLITERWKPRGLPTSFLIDPDGQVRYQAIGGRAWHQPRYTRFIDALLKHSNNASH